MTVKFLVAFRITKLMLASVWFGVQMPDFDPLELPEPIRPKQARHTFFAPEKACHWPTLD